MGSRLVRLESLTATLERAFRPLSTTVITACKARCLVDRQTQNPCCRPGTLI